MICTSLAAKDWLPPFHGQEDKNAPSAREEAYG